MEYKSLCAPVLYPFLILTGVVIAIGIVFYHLVKPMLVPLFLAGVTVLLIGE